MNKTILRSKTFWLQVVAVLSTFVPAVQVWLASNPVEFVAALAAANVLVRFVTRGTVSVFGDAAPKLGSGNLPGLLWCVVATGMTAVGTLPSCSAVPVAACVTSPQGSVCYGPATGVGIQVDLGGK